MELKKLFLTISMASAVALGGCSSGSDGSDDSDEPAGEQNNTTTGEFVDSAVAGLEYTTSSGIEGVTDSDGTFEYQEGDTVTFRVGAIEVGRVEADSTVTPLTVAGADSATNDYVANIAQMLQSLDDDGFAGNGIEITDDTRDVAAGLNGNEFDPASNNEEDFEKGLSDSIDELTQSNREPRTQGELVAREQATDHLQNTVNSLDRISACSDEDARSVNDEDLSGMAFVSILSGPGKDGEIRVEFADDNTFDELSNDNTSYTTDAASGQWRLLEGGTVLELDRPGDLEQLDVCISETDGTLLVGFEDENAFSRNSPQGSITESADVVGNYTLTVEGDQQGRLTITEESGSLSATLSTDNATFDGAAEISSGNLVITGLKDGAGNTRENATAYWVEGAVNQSAVYVEGNNDGSSRDEATLGKIEALGPVTQAGDGTFSSRAYFTRDGSDEIVILLFDSPSQGVFEEYANDFYSGTNREAKHRPGISWGYSNGQLSLDYEDGTSEKFDVTEGSDAVYVSEGNGEFPVRKAAKVNKAGMVGEYDVTVPTENTSERPLTLGGDGDCVLEDDIDCTWEVSEDQRRIDVTLTDFPEVPVYIWKIAGLEGEYAYLQLSPEGAPEPGVMTER